MADEFRTVRMTLPDGEKLSGKDGSVSGADVQALWHAWNAGEIPDPAAGDEVVQPRSRPLAKFAGR